MHARRRLPGCAGPSLLGARVLLAVDAVLLLHAPQLRLLVLQADLLFVPRGVVVKDDEVAVLQGERKTMAEKNGSGSGAAGKKKTPGQL